MKTADTIDGYTVVKQADAFGKPLKRGGWHLLDPEGDYLCIGDHGCTAPTKNAAIQERVRRLAHPGAW